MCPSDPTQLMNRRPPLSVRGDTQREEQRMLENPLVYFVGINDAATVKLLKFIEDKVSLRRMDNLPEFKRIIRQAPPDIVFCSWEFPSGDWKDVITATEEMDSDIPVIVISKEEDGGAWFEVFKGGGFDMLAPPFRISTVEWVLHQAIESRLVRSSKPQARKA